MNNIDDIYKKCGKCAFILPRSKFVSGKWERVCKYCDDCRRESRERTCKHECIFLKCGICNPRKKYSCPHRSKKIHCVECGGKGICQHGIIKLYCVECGGSQICEHNKNKNSCKQCLIKVGTGVCMHGRYTRSCKKCSPDPLKLVIKRMITQSRINDKKYNRYNSEEHITIEFLEDLFEKNKGMKCMKCNKGFQIIDYGRNLCTIDRIDNKIGHIKSNCLLACRHCNFTTNRGIRKKQSNIITPEI